MAESLIIAFVLYLWWTTFMHEGRLAELLLFYTSVLFNVVSDSISFGATGQTKGLTVWRWSMQWECDGGQQ